MSITGHKTRAIFDRYNIVNERDINEAAMKLEQRLQTSLGILSGIPATPADNPPASVLPN